MYNRVLAIMNFNRFIYILNKPFKSWKNKYFKYLLYKDCNNHSLYQETIKEISDYTGEPVDVVKERSKNLSKENMSWSTATEEEIISYYKNDSSYLYELPLWNAERNRGEYIARIIAPYLLKNKVKTVLDFGAGAGDILIALAKRGFKVTYTDINSKLIDFVQWRFKRRNLKVDVHCLNEDLILPAVDCVVTFDVLEHLEDIPKYIKLFSSALSDRGVFVFSGAFQGGDSHLEKNEIYNNFKCLDSLLKKNNLIFYDQFAQYYFYNKR